MTVNEAVTQLTALGKRGYGATWQAMWTVYILEIVRAGPRTPYPIWRALDPNERRARDILKNQTTAEFLRR